LFEQRRKISVIFPVSNRLAMNEVHLQKNKSKRFFVLGGERDIDGG